MKQNKIIGVISATTISLVLATLFGPSNINSVYADANCAKAENTDNPTGNFKGNSKQCSVNTENQGPEEPIRKCDTPNALKNNDEDANVSCKFRGNN
jgi:hypothetical protein